MSPTPEELRRTATHYRDATHAMLNQQDCQGMADLLTDCAEALEAAASVPPPESIGYAVVDRLGAIQFDVEPSLTGALALADDANREWLSRHGAPHSVVALVPVPSSQEPTK